MRELCLWPRMHKTRADQLRMSGCGLLLLDGQCDVPGSRGCRPDLGCSRSRSTLIHFDVVLSCSSLLFEMLAPRGWAASERRDQAWVDHKRSLPTSFTPESPQSYQVHISQYIRGLTSRHMPVSLLPDCRNHGPKGKVEFQAEMYAIAEGERRTCNVQQERG